MSGLAGVPWRRVTAMTGTSAGPRSTPWLWISAIWCAGGLFDASQTVLIMHAEGKQHPWLPMFGTELALWLPWVLATPLLSGLARRLAITQTTAARTAAIHLAAFVAISLIAAAWCAT